MADTVADMSVKVFDALALLYVYHWTDLAYPGVKLKAERAKLLVTLKDGLPIFRRFSSAEDGDFHTVVKERYDRAIEDHIANTFGDSYEVTYDYWGAKCLHKKDGRFSAPQTGIYFEGDASGQFMAFSGAAALIEYTKRIKTELGLAT